MTGEPDSPKGLPDGVSDQPRQPHATAGGGVGPRARGPVLRLSDWKLRTIIAIAAVLAVSAGLVLLAGASPGSALVGAAQGAFGSRYQTAETILAAMPLAIVGLGAAISLRANLFNVGVQGQLQMGALTSTGLLLALPHLPAAVAIPIGAIAGMFGGAAWALLPAVMRAWRGVNEILSTLFMNYVAADVLAYFLRTVLQAPGAAVSESKALPLADLVPKALSGTRLSWCLLLVPIAAFGLAWWQRTPRGFGVDVFGTHPQLAARMGLRPKRTIILTMVASGAAAGLAGWMVVAGVDGTLYPSVAGDIGFNGIVAAILGGSTAIGILLAAALFGFLETGGGGLQFGIGIPADIAPVLEGIIILAAALVMGRKLGVIARRVPRRLIVETDESPQLQLARTSRAASTGEVE